MAVRSSHRSDGLQVLACSRPITSDAAEPVARRLMKTKSNMSDARPSQCLRKGSHGRQADESVIGQEPIASLRAWSSKSADDLEKKLALGTSRKQLRMSSAAKSCQAKEGWFIGPAAAQSSATEPWRITAECEVPSPPRLPTERGVADGYRIRPSVQGPCRPRRPRRQYSQSECLRVVVDEGKPA